MVVSPDAAISSKWRHILINGTPKYRYCLIVSHHVTLLSVMDPIQQLVHQVSTMVAHEEEQGQMKHVSFGRCCKCIKYKIYCVQNGGASI